MTTRELIEHLQTLDPSGNALVTERRYSDDGPMDPGSWSSGRAYRRDNGTWYMRDHHSLSDEERLQAVDIIHYEGN